MNAAPRLLRVGDEVRFDGQARTVAAIDATLVTLATRSGDRIQVTLADLYQSGPVGNACAGTPPMPEDDPVATTLTQRERAKAAELTALGQDDASERSVRRKRTVYEEQPPRARVGSRYDRPRPGTGRADERVVAAIRQVIAETVHESTHTVTFMMRKTEQLLAAEHGRGTVPMPSRTSFSRLFKRLSQDHHTTGSAMTRRSMAGQPQGPYRTCAVQRPGELTEIASTSLDIAVQLPRGVVGRVELTGLYCVGSETLCSGVMHPQTKSVDASLLLARTVTPELMRPGWGEALHMSRSVLPYESLLSIDQRLQHAAAKPVIVPEVIVFDQGKVFISENFRASCRQLGIDLQPGFPAEKPHIEEFMSTVGAQFSHFFSGYPGSSAERHGYRAEQTDRLWTLPQLQEFFDEWVVCHWQNRPHEGLGDPLAPGRMFTPNERYSAMVKAAGYAPVALSADDYIELLPAEWRAITQYGVKIGHRVYDCKELVPHRRQRSGLKSRHGLWEVHYDPYDITRVWVRNHKSDKREWMMAYWKLLQGKPGRSALSWESRTGGASPERQ